MYSYNNNNNNNDNNNDNNNNNNNSNNDIFLIYKLLNLLVDYGSKPTCPGREVSCTECSQEKMSQINTEKTVYVEHA